MSKQIKNRFICHIRDLNENGQGIATHNGKVVFVNSAIPGDIAEVEIIKSSKKYDVARVIELQNNNLIRSAAFCPIYKICGGCNTQHLSYAATLNYKRSHVINCLNRIGGLNFDQNICTPCIGMDLSNKSLSEQSGIYSDFSSITEKNSNNLNYERQKLVTAFDQLLNTQDYSVLKEKLNEECKGLFYRNKVIYAAENKNGCLSLGFYAPRSHSVCSFPLCSIQASVFDLIKNVICEFCDEYGISAYDESNETGCIRKVFLRRSTAEYKLQLCLSIYENLSKELLLDLADTIDKALAKNCYDEILESFYININRSRGNKVMGDKFILIRGKERITDSLLGLKFNLSPQAFFQVNSRQTEILYKLAIDSLGDISQKRVLDLYCGTGTITLLMAQKSQAAFGIELVQEAISDAKLNAKINSIDNVEFICGKAEDELELLISKLGNNFSSPICPVPSHHRANYFDIIVLDPPRKGAELSLLDTILRLKPEKILYISCHPASLARDLKYLCEEDYELEKIIPVDMFAFSTHVETVCLMRRVR